MAKQKNKYGRILIVDDDADVLRAARIFLSRHFRKVVVENNPALIPGILQEEEYDLVLLDMNFSKDRISGREGFTWLQYIRELDPSIAVVLITAYGDVEQAVQAMKRGASDFIQKPWENQKLLATIVAAIKRRGSQTGPTDRVQEETARKFPGFIGQSPAIRKVFATIENVSRTNANVLVLGENGTGKELVARAIHQHSDRAHKPFVGVDLGAIPDTLFESELFGHLKGAFTDARSSRAGRFRSATGGTLFLDEIGNLSASSQAKLLRVLEKREVIPLGSNTAIPIDIRLVCATNQPLSEMVAQKQFRQDLLYRINTIEIKLPPLRERVSDIPLLTDHFLNIYRQKYQKNIQSVDQAALEYMQTYHWPGNVRELQHAIERAVILSNHLHLKPEDFLLQPSASRKRDTLEIDWDNMQLEDIEKVLIRKALKKHQGNVTQAARELGLTRASLYRRMEKYRL